MRENLILKSGHTYYSGYLFIFIAGLMAMSVSGWFLIEGMLNFATKESTRYMLAASGIMFQITETVCFFSVVSLDSKHKQWRIILFGLGILLFAFSVTVITITQKAILHSSEAQSIAIDKHIASLETHINSLEKNIIGYRFNAKNQSNSIYADSRKLGSKSLERAIGLEDEKYSLNEKLNKLYKSKQQTSIGFFQQIESITGLPARKIEFSFLILRSLLIELSGVLLLAFSSFVRRSHAEKILQDAKINTSPKLQYETTLARKNMNASHEPSMKRRKNGVEYEHLLTLLKQLLASKKLIKTSQQAIKDALLEHHNISIGTTSSSKIQKLLHENIKQQINFEI